MTVTTIRTVEDTILKKKVLVERDGEYFIVSWIATAPDHPGTEALVFAANEDGEITSWTDLAGGRNMTIEEAIADLDANGPDPDGFGRGMFGDGKCADERDLGDLLDGLSRFVDGMARGCQQ